MNSSKNTQRSISQNCDDITKSQSEIFERYFNIAMWYEGGHNNTEIGKARFNLTLLIAARFGLTSPRVIAHLYDISLRQAREHLNKLVARKLLIKIDNHRSVDGRVYVCDRQGAKIAEEKMCIPVPFKRWKRPEEGLNQLTISHDLINSLVILRMLHESSRITSDCYAFNGFMSEPEFKRHMTSTNTRIVDGLLSEPFDNGNNIIALEIENSFKNKKMRSAILLRYLEGLKAGIYDKVFFVSQRLNILNDIKRLHTQLLEELTEVRNKKTGLPYLTHEDAELLRQSLVYRTKYCDELTAIFYS